jgi:hypothetical protein
VTRRKGETNTSHNQKNGYAPNQAPAHPKLLMTSNANSHPQKSPNAFESGLLRFYG